MGVIGLTREKKAAQSSKRLKKCLHCATLPLNILARDNGMGAVAIEGGAWEAWAGGLVQGH